jgi:hypothetical protein
MMLSYAFKQQLLSQLILLSTFCFHVHSFCPRIECGGVAVVGKLFAQRSIPVTVEGPDEDNKPDYEKVHGPLGKFVDEIFLRVFRSQMAEKVGLDSSLPYVSYSFLFRQQTTQNVFLI